eukprot:TRINITY_DN10768_c0_g2_i2.p1 TRINITY_DN10768_c0_g2~~TRINITY_DN10768_c0_g2_i2.p1  ORF type:complete len:406 (+),score=140.14 TRINITY_DN10768_c0_g2_i2:255-1472(+)
MGAKTRQWLECAWCGASHLGLRPCSCHTAMYCDTDCQENAWEVHRFFHTTQKRFRRKPAKSTPTKERDAGSPVKGEAEESDPGSEYDEVDDVGDPRLMMSTDDMYLPGLQFNEASTTSGDVHQPAPPPPPHAAEYSTPLQSTASLSVSSIPPLLGSESVGSAAAGYGPFPVSQQLWGGGGGGAPVAGSSTDPAPQHLGGLSTPGAGSPFSGGSTPPYPATPGKGKGSPSELAPMLFHTHYHSHGSDGAIHRHTHTHAHGYAAPPPPPRSPAAPALLPSLAEHLARARPPDQSAAEFGALLQRTLSQLGRPRPRTEQAPPPAPSFGDPPHVLLAQLVQQAQDLAVAPPQQHPPQTPPQQQHSDLHLLTQLTQVSQLNDALRELAVVPAQHADPPTEPSPPNAGPGE